MNVQTTVGCKVKSVLRTLVILILSNSVAQGKIVKTHALKSHKTKINSSVKTCPKKAMDIADEVLKLELAGMRWRNSKDSCFESLKMNYVHGVKNPDGTASGIVKVKKNSLKIISVKENKEFYSYDILFAVKNTEGLTVEDSISFMLNADLGAKKPKRGCVLISAAPAKAYVSEACL